MASGERTIRIKFDGSAKGLAAESAKARAELKALEAQTDGNREKFDKLIAPVGNAATSLLSLGQRLAALGTLTQVLPALVAGIAAMAGALPLAVAGGFALAGTMVAVKLGADGAKKAFSQLDPQLNNLKAAVSSSFEKALLPAVHDLQTLLPATTSGFQQIVTALGGALGRITSFLATAKGTGEVTTILSGTARVIQNLGQFLAPVIQAFLRIGAVAMPILVQLTSGIGAAGEKFNAFVQHAADTGNLTQWIQGAVNAFTSLFGLLGQIGGIIGDVLGAMTDAGGGLSGVLGPIIGQVKAFLDSAQGHDTLVSLFQSLQAVSQAFGQVFGAVLQAVAPAIPPLADAFAKLATTVSGMLLPVVKFLAPVLQNIATFVQQNTQWITPLLIAIGLWTAAQWLLNIALDANPVGLVIIAIGALIAIVAVIITYWGPIKDFFLGIFSAISHAIQIAAQWISDRFSDAVSWVRSSWSSVTDFFSGILSGVQNGVSAATGWIRDRFGDAVDGVKGFFSGLGSFISNIWSGIGSGLKSALNGLIRIANGAISGVNRITGSVGIPAIPNIPYLARGGTAQAGQSYLVGERGPELFTPGQTGRVTANAQTFGGPRVIQLAIDLGEAITQRVSIAIDENGRQTGRNVLAGIGGRTVTVTATYKGDLSRVRVSFTGAPVIADFAKVERSTDGLNWTVVRGGDVVPLTPGYLDDYEFAAGLPNTYRVSFVDSGPIVSTVSPGAAATGNNVSLTPALPAGLAEGDGMLLAASIRTTSATITTPAGWTRVLDLGNVVLFGKRATAAETAPTVAFAGGAAGADTVAQINAWKNLDITPVTTNTISNAAAQNVNVPALTVPRTNMLNLWLAWKQSSWTSVTDPAGFAVIGSTASAAGTGAGLWWSYTVQGTTTISFLARVLTVAGGTSAVSTGMALAFSAAPYVTRQTATITPVLDRAWLKNPRRPSLNTPVTITEVGDITRKARSGTFDVIGRTMPVVVSDVMSSRSLPITIMVPDLAAAADLETRLAAGDPVFLQAPSANVAVPTMYATVGGLSASKASARGIRRYYALDLTEVAAPASTVYGGTITYADVPGLYASYDALASSVATYFNLMDLVAVSTVIVP